MRRIRVLFVCTGNICRSPMAEAVFSHLVNQAGLTERFEISSGGTDSWHIGQRPHRGTQEILNKYQVSLRSDKVSHLVSPAEVPTYDYVLAMDQSHIEDLRGMRGNVHRLLEYSGNKSTLNVPDPYYEGNFQAVYDLVRMGCEGFLEAIRKKENL
jgi:protein-tyrosine phosphatase